MKQLDFLLKKTCGGPHCRTLVVKGQPQRGWMLSFPKEPHGGDKEQQVQVAPGEVLSRYHKDVFYRKNNHSVEQSPQGCGGVPIDGGFSKYS